jgi:hypothetical protein
VAACEARVGETASRLGARQEGLKCLSEAEIELARAEGMAAGLDANHTSIFSVSFSSVFCVLEGRGSRGITSFLLFCFRSLQATPGRTPSRRPSALLRVQWQPSRGVEAGEGK